MCHKISWSNDRALNNPSYENDWKVYPIVYYITRGETERLHECEVCCPNETRAVITRNTKCFRCLLFRVMHTIFHSNSFENLIGCNCNPRVESRLFNPLYRYRKSDFQMRRYEKYFIFVFYMREIVKCNFVCKFRCNFGFLNTETFYSQFYNEIHMWIKLRISKSFQSILFEWNLFQCCLIPEKKFDCIIWSVWLDIIHVLLKYFNVLFFNLQYHILPFFNI